jgi:hypothetical protein
MATGGKNSNVLRMRVLVSSRFSKRAWRPVSASGKAVAARIDPAMTPTMTRRPALVKKRPAE